MKSLYFKLSYLAFKLYFQTRYYSTWSRLYRWLYEDPTLKMEVGVRSDAENLAIRRLLQWRADGVKELFDAAHSPEYVEWVAHETADKAPGDCDDFAVWNAACAAKQGYRSALLMVGWFNGLKPSGHAVAMRQRGLTLQWCDYNDWMNAKDFCDVARQVAANYRGDGAVFYAYLDARTLTPIDFWYEAK